MLNGKFFRIVVSVFLILSIWAPAFALFSEKIGAFTADQITTGADGSVLSQGKLFVTPDKIRLESKPSMGNAFIMIFRKDTNVQWMIDPTQKTYFQNSLDEKEWRKLIQSGEPGSERILGEETINGYVCTKKEVVSTVNIMGMSITSKSIIWVSDKFEAPLRTQMEDGSITELRNIKKESSPASTFELPVGYKQVEGFGAFGMGMGMQNEPADEDSEDTPSDADNEEAGSGFKLPKGLKLPEGFKLPF